MLFVKLSTFLPFLTIFVITENNPETIVHLFEWKWIDIAKECESFLPFHNYTAIQISPPNECIIAPNRPWWERYQPVSYKIVSRSGDEDAFKDMTRRCNANKIRIYVDVVINHMAGADGVGVGGSISNASKEYYPGVPYGSGDFHSDCAINNYQNAENTKSYVRNQITNYLNHLILLGAAGFRINAAKHMWPKDLQQIYQNLNNLNEQYGFEKNTRPFIYQEVIDLGGEAVKSSDYNYLGSVTEMKYSNSISNVFQGNDKLLYLGNWGSEWGFMSGDQNPIVFVDNHDTQREFGRLNYKNSKQYKMAVGFMLAHPYGIPKVMSSFDFKNRDQGPPNDPKTHTITSPKINSDDSCSNGWICEHRWRQIYSMVEFRNLVYKEKFHEFWSNGDQQISFCRGNKGFIALTNFGDLQENLQTCLPPGTYCDIISGKLLNKNCTGKSVHVDKNGMAFIKLLSNDYDGIFAIHIRSRL